ncbi:MAG: hypothetical protein ACFFBD_11185 [Candidatus Hodarchaeota archaeon]
MTKGNNKKVTSRVVKTPKVSLILKVKAYTPIAKPLNGSLPRSNQSHFLKLQPIKYHYGKGNEKKETEMIAYHIKRASRVPSA